MQANAEHEEVMDDTEPVSSFISSASGSLWNQLPSQTLCTLLLWVSLYVKSFNPNSLWQEIHMDKIVIQQMHYFIKLSRSRVISPMRWLMFSYPPSVFFPRCTIWQPSNGDSALMTHSGNGWGCWRNIHWEDRPTQQLSGLVKTGSVSSVAPQIWYRSCDTHHKFLS